MVFPKENFAVATPESQGVKSQAIIDALEAMRSSGKDIHSMLIIKNGYMISETYFAPYTETTKHSQYSCSKTFTSMLIGIAQEKGLLRLNDTVASFFPNKLPKNPNANLLRMTIRDLLSMATGNDKDTFGYLSQSADWVQAFLARPVEHEPGTFFRYNTGATYMLSAILTKLTGKTALQLANEWIFDAIGIRNAQWDSSPEGVSLGGTGLHITPRQMARFGLLLLNKGKWEETQLIPEDYVLEAQQKHIDTSNHINHPDWCAGYCYQMWRCSFDAYRADGMGGQFIVVFPEQNAVVVVTSALGSDIVFPMDVVGRYLADALRGVKPIPENKEAQRALNSLSALCSKPERQSMPAEVEAVVPWGKKIVLSEKLLGMVRTMTIYRNTIVFETDIGDGTFGYEWGAPELSLVDVQLPIRKTPCRLSFMASWKGERLVLRVNVLEEPATMYLTMAFANGRATIDLQSTALLPNATIAGMYA